MRPDSPAGASPEERGSSDDVRPATDAGTSSDTGRAPDGGSRPPRGGPDRLAHHRESLEGAVSSKAARKLRARREGDRGIWFGLGMMGLVGWSVAVPTVVGIAIGVWLDRRSADPGGVSWTLTCLVLGVTIGCVNAWVWIQRELHGRD